MRKRIAIALCGVILLGFSSQSLATETRYYLLWDAGYCTGPFTREMASQAKRLFPSDPKRNFTTPQVVEGGMVEPEICNPARRKAL